MFNQLIHMFILPKSGAKGPLGIRQKAGQTFGLSAAFKPAR
ncbi:hypothetical protein STRDD12_00153 [Streptococcus sp. DD12]|nr:hypothetical protein STRDD12_00153 [Streptococcus sp. DD12]